MYVWEEGGLIRHVTRSLMEAIGHAIENNVHAETSTDGGVLDYLAPDDEEDLELLAHLFDRLRAYDITDLPPLPGARS